MAFKSSSASYGSTLHSVFSPSPQGAQSGGPTANDSYTQAPAPGAQSAANPRGFRQTGIDLLNAELAKRGIGPNAAPGAIAGIMGESGANLDPTSFNSKDPGGGSGGIGQWNRGRLIGPTGMLAFARNAGIPVDVNNPLDAKKVPLAIQTQYLGHELDTTYAGVRSQLQAAKSPQDALNIWVNSYENPANKSAAIAQRSQYLAPVSAALQNAPAGPLSAPDAQAPGPMDPSAQAGGPGAPLGTPGSTVNPPIPTTFGTTINSNPMASSRRQDGRSRHETCRRHLRQSPDDARAARPTSAQYPCPRLGGAMSRRCSAIPNSMPSGWPRSISR